MEPQRLLSQLCFAAILCACAVLGRNADASEYPSQPVKIVTQGAAGSGPDVIARIIADHLGRTWEQQVVILNQAGAGGAIAARVAASAPADGYTLYMPAASTFVVLPETQTRLSVDLERDFVPIGLVAEQPMVIAVAAPLGINSLPELITSAQKRPEEILYAGTIRGGMPHLTGELLQSRTGARLTFVSYQGAPQALHDVLGGRVSVMVESMGALAGTLEGGGLKALAVASAKRLPNYPNLPTVAETIPDFERLVRLDGADRDPGRDRAKGERRFAKGS